MREKVETIAAKNGKIHLGLGCHLRTSDPRLTHICFNSSPLIFISIYIISKK